MDLSHKRILIIKPSSLGDVVHTLPTVHAVKRCFPSCHIGWIVQRGFAGILEADSAIDEIIPIFIPSTSDPGGPRDAYIQAALATARTLYQLRRRLASGPYDLVLDLHASFRSGLLGLTNPGGTRVGFAGAKELNTLFQHKLVQPDPSKPHAVDQNFAFAAFLGVEPRPEDFHLAVSANDREKAGAFLAESGLNNGAGIVYANPAARWETKMWTVEAWAELADQLARAGVGVVFAGSPADAALIGEITCRMKERAVVSAGKLSLGESAALLEASDVYVGVDSGPMHVAALVGTPVVALFGPTDPQKVGPYGRGHKVIRRQGLECLGCRKRVCDRRRCLEDITPQEVYGETMKVLDRPGSQSPEGSPIISENSDLSEAFQ